MTATSFFLYKQNLVYTAKKKMTDADRFDNFIVANGVRFVKFIFDNFLLIKYDAILQKVGSDSFLVTMLRFCLLALDYIFAKSWQR